MYLTVLAIHSWVRWAALVAGIGATAAALRDRSDPGRFGPADRWGLALMMAVDIQILLGLVLFLVVSPNMDAIRANFGAALQDPRLRFWAVEHIGTMLTAAVLVHVGRGLASNVKTTLVRRILLFVCFGLATIGMIAATPWPGTANGRPLFRL